MYLSSQTILQNCPHDDRKKINKGKMELDCGFIMDEKITL